ncbi:MAG: LCP family protein [Mycobacteriaceae bacterium]
MSDEHTPEPLGPPHRAPWERRVSEKPDLDKPLPTHRPQVRRSFNGDLTDTTKLSVAELLAKMGQPEASAKTTGTRPRHQETPQQSSALQPGSDNRSTSSASLTEEPTRPDSEFEYQKAALAATQVAPSRAYHRPWQATAKPSVIGQGALVGQISPNKTGRSRAQKIARTLTAIVAVMAFIATGAAYTYQNSKDNRFNNVDAIDPTSSDIVDISSQNGDENYLIVGTDTRAGANGQMNAGDTEGAEGARSDTVMLVNIPANRSRVVAVSFPRDLAITPVICEAWDNDKGEYLGEKVYTETKLNSAYGFGGPKCLLKVIQNLSGLNINHFIGMDFSGFSKLVDQVGGVEVCSTKPIEDYELGTVLAQAGKQTIDGVTALQYVRARKVTTEINGDYGRIKRQQLFLSSLLRTALSTKMLFDPSRLNSFINTFISETFVDQVNTNNLVKLGRSLQGLDAGRVTFLTVPTDGTDEYGNEIPRTQGIDDIFSAIINDQPLPGEKKLETPTTAPAPTPREVTAIDPSAISLQVSNATNQTGLAKKTATLLTSYGFEIDSVGDFDKPIAKTTIRFSAGQEQAAATLSSAFPNASVEKVSGLGTVVQLVLGLDFTVAKMPAKEGTALSPVITTGGGDTVSLPADLTVTNASDTTCE